MHLACCDEHVRDGNGDEHVRDGNGQLPAVCVAYLWPKLH